MRDMSGSMEALTAPVIFTIRRLRTRGDTSEIDISRRLAIAAQEMAEAPGLFDAMIVNEEVEVAIAELAGLIRNPVPRPILPNG